MADNEAFLEEVQAELAEVLKPYQQRLNRRQRMADFVQQCMRCAGRNDFFQLDELLRSKMAGDVAKETGLKASADDLARLREYAAEQVDQYRIELIEDLETLAAEAELPMEIDFPRFYILKGIEGEVDFAERKTVLNNKTIRSVDPRRIIAAVRKVKQQLYDGPYEPQTFIDGLFKTYSKWIEKEEGALGDPMPMQGFYLEHVILLQSKSFFQNMDKGRFKGYSLDQFSVDLWRYFEAEIGGTSNGYALQLRSGRNNSLWLIDSDGQRRQFTAISFQET